MTTLLLVAAVVGLSCITTTFGLGVRTTAIQPKYADKCEELALEIAREHNEIEQTTLYANQQFLAYRGSHPNATFSEYLHYVAQNAGGNSDAFDEAIELSYTSLVNCGDGTNSIKYLFLKDNTDLGHAIANFDDVKGLHDWVKDSASPDKSYFVHVIFDNVPGCSSTLGHAWALTLPKISNLKDIMAERNGGSSDSASGSSSSEASSSALHHHLRRATTKKKTTLKRKAYSFATWINNWSMSSWMADKGNEQKVTWPDVEALFTLLKTAEMKKDHAQNLSGEVDNACKAFLKGFSRGASGDSCSGGTDKKWSGAKGGAQCSQLMKVKSYVYEMDEAKCAKNVKDSRQAANDDKDKYVFSYLGEGPKQSDLFNYFKCLYKNARAGQYWTDWSAGTKKNPCDDVPANGGITLTDGGSSDRQKHLKEQGKYIGLYNQEKIAKSLVAETHLSKAAVIQAVKTTSKDQAVTVGRGVNHGVRSPTAKVKMPSISDARADLEVAKVIQHCTTKPTKKVAKLFMQSMAGNAQAIGSAFDAAVDTVHVVTQKSKNDIVAKMDQISSVNVNTVTLALFQ